jgi:molybdate transport system substrate-binding protein
LQRAARVPHEAERRFRPSHPNFSLERQIWCRRRTAMSARLFAFLGFIVALSGVPQPLIAQEQITVFAAASLKNALDDANAAFTKATGIKVVASYEASSALAKQIEQGAPADVFISADQRWMDYAAEHKLIKLDTRANLLGNKLVLIASANSKLDNVTIAHGFDIAKLAGDGRIAIADVKAVPAGLYAKAALEKLGIWPATEPKLAQAENVRATLAFVARGETLVGIVYETDAKIEPKVKIIGAFPDDSYPPITYPVAATADTKKSGVASYLDFLRSSAAKAIFERYGFSFLLKPVS